MKARLSNPLPKTQAVKGGIRGGFRIGRGASGVPRFGKICFNDLFEIIFIEDLV